MGNSYSENQLNKSEDITTTTEDHKHGANKQETQVIKRKIQRAEDNTNTVEEEKQEIMGLKQKIRRFEHNIIKTVEDQKREIQVLKQKIRRCELRDAMKI